MRSEKTPANVTMKHIARLAGVSVATVSRALRNDPIVNGETAKRIHDLSRKLNYYPNNLAIGLRQNRTHTIGVIFNDLNNPFYTEILGEVTRSLHQAGYSMIVCHSNYSFEYEKNNIISLVSKKVDGIIMSPIDPDHENIRMLLRNGIETVFIDCLPRLQGQCHIYTDQKRGIRLAIEYVIRNGHREILLMVSPQDQPISELFQEIYLELHRENAMEIRKELIVEAREMSIDSGYRAFKDILTRNLIGREAHFTAIVTMNDLLAIGIYKAANELGIAIPDSYSIIGYDDIEMASALNPPLTTVHQSRRRIGEECVKKLLRNLEDGEKDRQNLVFDPYIVRRGSVRNLQGWDRQPRTGR